MTICRCNPNDLNMWQAKYPDIGILPHPYIKRGLLMSYAGRFVECTEEYAKKEALEVERNQYEDEMLADGTGD